MNFISRINDLKYKLDNFHSFDIFGDKRLWQKFRLEWNYNSNHIEGNTLTYGETMQLLIKGRMVNDHAVKEYDEMRAHDLVVELIKKIALHDSRIISESDIREWNKILLVKIFWKSAVSLDGQETRKKNHSRKI